MGVHRCSGPRCIYYLRLLLAGKKFSHATAEIVEGVSKLVAVVCVLQLSAKVPKGFGIYGKYVLCFPSNRKLMLSYK